MLQQCRKWILDFLPRQAVPAADGIEQFEEEIAPPRLQVQPWVRLLLCGACLLPMVAMLWALLSEFEHLGPSNAFAMLSWLSIFAAFAWILARLWSLCSVALDGAGIAQSFLLSRRGVARRRQLRWDQVQRISYAGSSWCFLGADGMKLELNTMLLDDPEATLQTLRGLLPPRLLPQLAVQHR